jgi:hypothetical protein
MNWTTIGEASGCCEDGRRFAFGSVAAGLCPKPPTSAFASKGDIPRQEVINLPTAANGQKQTFTCNDL